MAEQGLRGIFISLLNGILSGNWLLLISFILILAVYWILTGLIIKIANKFINKVFMNKKTNDVKEERRYKTIGTLLKSVTKYLFYFVFIMMCLSEFGVNTTGLLASAGILGLAVGFGAQSLVKDIISGFFIIFEDQYAVEDYVTIGDKTGIVEEIALRVTKIRDLGGQIYIIPNGNVEEVTNYRTKDLRVLFDVTVAYGTDPDYVISLLQKEYDANKHKFNNLVKGPTVIGVSDLSDKGIVLRIYATGIPLQHWQLERDLRLFAKKVLDDNNIGVPYTLQKVTMEKE